MILYSKKLEISASYDVVVAGSGPSGICAAVAAARQGMSVALVERYGVLGGDLTIASVGPMMGSVAKGTMRDELAGRIRVAGNNMQATNGFVHDIEQAKRIFAEFLDEAGVTVYLQTYISDVIKDGNTVTGLVISERSGMSVILSKRVIDATGDGDVSVFAGADWEMGRESDSKTQPVTLMYLLSNVDERTALKCFGEEDNVQLNGERFLDFTARCCKLGKLPVNCASVRLYPTLYPGERLVNTTQANGINPLSSKDIIKAEIELRRQINAVTDFLRKNVPGYENCVIKSTANTLGVRESRRIMGEYQLCLDDLRAGKRFDDVVVHKANFTVDIHNPDGSGQANGLAEVVKAYDIPYRCLIPLKVDNLVVTGRCISSTHEALASFRISTVCMALGEAAGIAAAVLGICPAPQRIFPVTAPDSLGIRTHQYLFVPAFQFFSAAAIQQFIIFPTLSDPHGQPSTD